MHPATRPLPAIRLAFAVLALSVASGGCDSSGPVTPSGPESLRVDFTHLYDEDPVQIELDGVLIYEGRVTTIDVLGLAESVSFSIPEGEHRVRVVVDGRASAAATFEAGQTVFVAVSYVPEERDVTLKLSDEVICCYD